MALVPLTAAYLLQVCPANQNLDLPYPANRQQKESGHLENKRDGGSVGPGSGGPVDSTAVIATADRAFAVYFCSFPAGGGTACTTLWATAASW